VVDSGGVKRVNCNGSTSVGPVTPDFTWVITKPDQSTVEGSSSTAEVVAGEPGEYSCTFTAAAERDCPPEPITIGPESKTLTFAATITADPTSIPATTPWPDMPANLSQSSMTVTWTPPECEGTLEIVEVDPIEGYTPPDSGTLTPGDGNTWRYDAFSEPATALCPKLVRVWIGAMQGELELSRVSILVKPVHVHWTWGASANFTNDYNFIRWKYTTVLATTGGAFTGGATISADTSVYCGTWPFGADAYACTTFHPLNGTYSVEFGTTTFTSTENQAASIIGHELVHASGVPSECTAYTWEFNNDTDTGIYQCDATYLAEVAQKKNCKCDGVNCP